MKKMMVVVLAACSLAACGSTDSHDFVYAPTIVENNSGDVPIPNQNWSWNKSKSPVNQYGRPVYDNRFRTPLSRGW